MHIKKSKKLANKIKKNLQIRHIETILKVGIDNKLSAAYEGEYNMRNALLYVLSALSVSVCVESSDGMFDDRRAATYSYDEARAVFCLDSNLLRQADEISIKNTTDIDNLASVYQELHFPKYKNIDYVKGYVYKDMKVLASVKENPRTSLTFEDIQALQRLEATVPAAIQRAIQRKKEDKDLALALRLAAEENATAIRRENEDKDLAFALSLEAEENATTNSPQVGRVPSAAGVAEISPEKMQAIQFVTGANSKASIEAILEYVERNPDATADDLVENFLILQ